MRLTPGEAQLRYVEVALDERICARGAQKGNVAASISTATTTTLVTVPAGKAIYVFGLDVTTAGAQRIQLKVGSSVVWAGNFAANGGAALCWKARARGTGEAGADLSLVTAAGVQLDVGVDYCLVDA